MKNNTKKAQTKQSNYTNKQKPHKQTKATKLKHKTNPNPQTKIT